MRSAARPRIASQIVSGPDISPACGTLCSPARTAAANASRIASSCPSRSCSMPPMPKPTRFSGGWFSAWSAVAWAASAPNSPGMSKTYATSMRSAT